jgi:hypothetical protein
MSIRAVNIVYCYYYCSVAAADDYVMYQPAIIAI